jgi:hypothetical protein
MMSFAPKRRMDWLPDYPDFRDYTEDTEAIQDLLHPIETDHRCLDIGSQTKIEVPKSGQ